MGPFLKQAMKLLMGSMSGSNNKANFVVHTLRVAYIGSGSIIVIAYYSAYRNERVEPGSISFPFPFFKNLKRQFTPDRPEKELPHAKSGGRSKLDIPGREGHPEGSPLLPSSFNGPPGLSKGIAKANEMSGRYPYKWGGGHIQIGHPSPGIAGGSAGTAGGPPGYDCSGAVSAVLGAMGLLSSPLDSGSLESFGEAGEGKWVTVYANFTHTFMKININGTWRWFGTGSNKQALRGGPAWGNNDAGDLAAYAVRHPRGY